MVKGFFVSLVLQVVQVCSTLGPEFTNQYFIYYVRKLPGLQYNTVLYALSSRLRICDLHGTWDAGSEFLLKSEKKTRLRMGHPYF